jgi:integrase
MPSQTTSPALKSVKSLRLDEWPQADQAAWREACREGKRLQKGGPAAQLRPITRADLARRYGYFLDFVERTERLDPYAAAAGYVTPDRVERFLSELQLRVGSVTAYGTIYKLRRIAQLLCPATSLEWLMEIEKDLDLMKRPKSKLGRFVYSHELVEAGLALMHEANEISLKSLLVRARQYRDGLMIALLAMHPIRLKNFAALVLGHSLKQAGNSCWIVLAAAETKEKRADEREVDPTLVPWLQTYLKMHRPILTRDRCESGALWLSSNDGKPMKYSGVARAITDTTLQTTGKKISPHMFRTAAASTSAVYAGHQPHLATALLHHVQAEVTEEHYNRATALSAACSYGALIRSLG